MISVNYSGSIGDQFFQYCYARSVAQKLNYRLAIQGIPGLPGTYRENSGLEVYWPWFRMTPLSIADFLDQERQHPVALRMEGSWQNLDVARKLGDVWRDWTIDGGPQNHVEGSLGLCWSVGRAHDHCESGFDPDWLIPVLDVFTPSQLIIVTEGPRAPDCTGLVDCPVTHLRGGSIDNLLRLSTCERLIVGTSAFDLMAGVLTVGHTVYYRDPAKSCCSSQIDIPCPINATRSHLNGKKKWIDFSEVLSTT